MPPRARPANSTRRLDVAIDTALYDQVHAILQDPMRPDGRKRRGGLSSLITSLLADWVSTNQQKPSKLEDL